MKHDKQRGNFENAVIAQALERLQQWDRYRIERTEGQHRLTVYDDDGYSYEARVATPMPDALPELVRGVRRLIEQAKRIDATHGAQETLTRLPDDGDDSAV